VEDDTPQSKALDEAHRCLEESFDSWVIVARFSREEAGRTLDSVRHRQRGSFTDCRGLIEVMRDTMKNDHENKDDVPE
jgi:hypothetical protein